MVMSNSSKSPDADPEMAAHLFIVSAPSGAGKTTLCRAVRENYPDLAYSISYTSRTKRDGEKEGRDYHFITEAEFKEGIEHQRWAEWARVHGNYYGTAVQWITQTLDQGKDILMDIDVQGTHQMLVHFPHAVTIFIMPPSVAELERRLTLRGQDDLETIATRLKNAVTEMGHKGLYRHIVINDDLATATRHFIDLIAHYSSRRMNA